MASESQPLISIQRLPSIKTQGEAQIKMGISLHCPRAADAEGERAAHVAAWPAPGARLADARVRQARARLRRPRLPGAHMRPRLWLRSA